MIEAIVISDQDDRPCVRCRHCVRINELNIRCHHPLIMSPDDIFGRQPRHVRSARPICNGKRFEGERPCWPCRVVGISIVSSPFIWLAVSIVLEFFK